jgi:hypothetical protein
MAEVYSTVIAEQLNFEGLFTMKDLFRVIDTYFKFKGFDKRIVWDEEYDTQKGKYFHLRAEYYKKVDSYVRLQTRQWIYINDYKIVEKEIDGKKIKTAHGKLSITFDGFLQTEYFNIMPDNKPFYFLFKRLYEKAFASSRIKHWKHVSEHVIAELKTEIAGYLNLNKFIYER